MTRAPEPPERRRPERLVLTARLRPGAYERAEELASDAGPAGAGRALLRGSIFLSPSEVVFMIEGDDVDLQTRQWFDDPVLSSAFTSWLSLFEGPLHSAREVATWDWRAA
jgi:hypothetical protein